MKYKVWFQQNNKIKTKIVDDNHFPHNTIKKHSLDKKYPLVLLQKNNFLELFYEMKIMLEAKLTLNEVVEILLLSNNTKDINEILIMIKWSLENGKLIHKVLNNYKDKFGNLPILFFKFGEENGDMKGSIDALYQLLNEYDLIKSKIFRAIKYPFVLASALVVSLVMIFSFVVPQFEHLFLEFTMELPLSTKVLLGLNEFISTYALEMISILVLCLLLSIYFYHNYKIYIHKVFYYHIPLFSKMYQKLVTYKLFLSLYFICSTKSRFQDALKSVVNISNNIYFNKKLNSIYEDIQNGTNISEAFSTNGLFDDSTIRLLRSGEKSNSLESVLDDIKEMNKKKLEKSIERFTSSLEPILIFVLAGVILWIVLAIMTPTWELGNLMN